MRDCHRDNFPALPPGFPRRGRAGEPAPGTVVAPDEAVRTARPPIPATPEIPDARPNRAKPVSLALCPTAPPRASPARAVLATLLVVPARRGAWALLLDRRAGAGPDLSGHIAKGDQHRHPFWRDPQDRARGQIPHRTQDVDRAHTIASVFAQIRPHEGWQQPDIRPFQQQEQPTNGGDLNRHRLAAQIRGAAGRLTRCNPGMQLSRRGVALQKQSVSRP